MQLLFRFCFHFLVLFPYLGLTNPIHAAERPDHLVAAMPKYFPPIYSVSRNNVPTGYGVAFMELVAEHARLDIEYRSAASWPHAIQMVRQGEADIIPNFGITDDRTEGFSYSKPYDVVSLSIFVRRTTHDINGLDDLKGSSIGVVEFNRGQSLLATEPDINMVTYGSLGQLVAALKAGEVDAAVYPAKIFEYFIDTLGIYDTFKKVGEPLEAIKRAIAVRKELSDLIPVLNQGIDAAMASPEYERIYDRWHPAPRPFWNSSRILMLVAVLFFSFIGLWALYRYSMTRRFNRELIRYSNFNNAILTATSDGIITVNSNHLIVSLNAFAETLFGVSQSDLSGRPVARLLPGDDFYYLLEQTIDDASYAASGEPLAHNYSLETMAIRKDMEAFPVRVGLARMGSGRDVNVVCTVHDESRTHEAERRADRLLKNDPLTGAMNQRGLLEVLSDSIRSGAGNIYCFCLGLTHMTQINSIYGRHVGDNVLVRVANALELSYAGSNDVKICRNSGNHFVVTIIDPTDGMENMAQSIADAIKSLKIVIEKNSGTLTIDFALGASVYPDHATTPFELINNAEIAYAQAKHQGFENYSVYTPEVRMEQSEIEAAYQRVKSALNEDRVVLHFQPIQTIDTQKIHHFEALVRMYDIDGALIMPADIIPIAEQFNLITQIDYKVMRLALEQISALRQHHPEIAISVNLSAKHIGDARLHELIRSDMSRHGIDFANLIFEITETAALQNFAAAREFMANLAGFGCRFALDDFGVGFTSFAQLRTLPVDIVKIDGMFIRELHMNRQDQVFVKAMTDVAHSLGKKVVAEYVENADIVEFLREYGVDYAQGFYIGRPRPQLFVQDA